MVHNSNSMGQHLKEQHNNVGDGGEIIGLLDMCKMCNLTLVECNGRRGSDNLCSSRRQAKSK